MWTDKVVVQHVHDAVSSNMTQTTAAILSNMANILKLNKS